MCFPADPSGGDGAMQALKTFGDEVGIAWSGAEDVALVEYAHLTGRPYRVFRCGCCAGGPKFCCITFDLPALRERCEDTVHLKVDMTRKD